MLVRAISQEICNLENPKDVALVDQKFLQRWQNHEMNFGSCYCTKVDTKFYTWDVQFSKDSKAESNTPTPTKAGQRNAVGQQTIISRMMCSDSTSVPLVFRNSLVIHELVIRCQRFLVQQY